MALFQPIYEHVLSWAKHRHAERFLAGVSFAESSFFPIPVDVMLAPMVFARRDRWWQLAAITTLWSVIGGVFGFLIGVFFFDAWGDQILTYFDAHETFADIQASYIKHGMIIILLAGFTPVPYKIFTIASGVIGVAIVPFILMSFIGRGARFFLVAGLIRAGGEKLESVIVERVELLGWATLGLVALAFVAYKLFA